MDVDATILRKAIINNRMRIKAKPNARKTAITKVEGDVVFLDVAAPPEDGKANETIERYLTKLTRRHATIKSGFSGKEKTVLFAE